MDLLRDMQQVVFSVNCVQPCYDKEPLVKVQAFVCRFLQGFCIKYIIGTNTDNWYDIVVGEIYDYSDVAVVGKKPPKEQELIYTMGYKFYLYDSTGNIIYGPFVDFRISTGNRKDVIVIKDSYNEFKIISCSGKEIALRKYNYVGGFLNGYSVVCWGKPEERFYNIINYDGKEVFHKPLYNISGFYQTEKDTFKIQKIKGKYEEYRYDELDIKPKAGTFKLETCPTRKPSRSQAEIEELLKVLRQAKKHADEYNKKHYPELYYANYYSIRDVYEDDDDAIWNTD